MQHFLRFRKIFVLFITVLSRFKRKIRADAFSPCQTRRFVVLY